MECFSPPGTALSLQSDQQIPSEQAVEGGGAGVCCLPAGNEKEMDAVSAAEVMEEMGIT